MAYHVLVIDFKTAEGLDSNLLKTYTRELERLRQFMLSSNALITNH